MTARLRTALTAAAILCVPAAALLAAAWGVIGWDIATIVSAVICCVPFFLSFERRAPSAGELVLAAVMTAFSAGGRFVFAPIPYFKPVTAIVVLSGMYLGPQTGFMVGALSAVVSNIYFGQGPWTPFQMFCWGMLGLSAGLMNRKKILEKAVPLVLYGLFAGVAYSVFMDIWTVLSMDGTFTLGRWGAAMISALPVTAVYCASNVVFLLVLRKPVGKRLERIKKKYGVFGGGAGNNNDEKTDRG